MLAMRRGSKMIKHENCLALLFFFLLFNDILSFPLTMEARKSFELAIHFMLYNYLALAAFLFSFFYPIGFLMLIDQI